MTRRIVPVITLLIMLTSGLAFAQRQTNGVILNESSAYSGFTLFGTLNGKNTYLMKNDGTIVKQWSHSIALFGAPYLLKNGHILRPGAQRSKVTLNANVAITNVQEYDWDGNLVWDFSYVGDSYIANHDVEPLPNGNVLIVALEQKSYSDAVSAGRNPQLLGANGKLWSGYIIEVKPEGTTGGRIVWQWHTWDHLIQDFSSTQSNYGTVAAHPELVDINFASATQDGTYTDWTHINGVGYKEALDQIIISVRNFSEIWVVDHSTTMNEAAGHSGGHSGKGGDILYRWGNPQAYGAGNSSTQKFYNQHNAQWIDSGLPGAGDIMVFNNGDRRPEGTYSSVDEMVPPVDEKGNYTLVTGSAYGPSGQTWIYTVPNKTDLYSATMSSAQRLPNGNTLICEGTSGTFFEVTSDKKTVWEYVNPYTVQLPSGTANAVFKVHRYSPDYAGLSNLTPFTPAIMANGKSDTISIDSKESLRINISLDTGDFDGINGDLWVVADSPLGIYSYNGSTGTWVEGLGCYSQDKLINISNKNVLTISGLPSGSYVFYFGADLYGNCRIDPDSLKYDSVKVKIL